MLIIIVSNRCVHKSVYYSKEQVILLPTTIQLVRLLPFVRKLTLIDDYENLVSL